MPVQAEAVLSRLCRRKRRRRPRPQRLINHNCFNSINDVCGDPLMGLSCKTMNLLEFFHRDVRARDRPPPQRAVPARSARVRLAACCGSRRCACAGLDRKPAESGPGRLCQPAGSAGTTAQPGRPVPPPGQQGPAPSRIGQTPTYGTPAASGASDDGYDSLNRKRKKPKPYPGAPKLKGSIGPGNRDDVPPPPVRPIRRRRPPTRRRWRPQWPERCLASRRGGD